jgi:hypothetical protein
MNPLMTSRRKTLSMLGTVFSVCLLGISIARPLSQESQLTQKKWTIEVFELPFSEPGQFQWSNPKSHVKIRRQDDSGYDDSGYDSSTDDGESDDPDTQDDLTNDDSYYMDSTTNTPSITYSEDYPTQTGLNPTIRH